MDILKTAWGDLLNENEKLAALLDEKDAEIERLEAAIAWTLEVYPGKTREGAAVVEMTWDQFNTMRALAGKDGT